MKQLLSHTTQYRSRENQAREEQAQEDKARENLDPLFLRTQALTEDLAHLAAFEARMRRIERKTLHSLHLGSAQSAALQTIAQNGGSCCVNELQQRLSVSKQSLHKSLEKLLTAGYIEKRGRDEKDRRRHVLALTTKGDELEARLGEQRASALKKAYGKVTAQQVEGFRHTLAHLNDDKILKNHDRSRR